MQQAIQHIEHTEWSASEDQHQEAMSQHSEQHQAEMFSSSFSFSSISF